MNIPYLDLKLTHKDIEKEIIESVSKVIMENDFILSKNCLNFEENFASYIGVKSCVSCGNGLDALQIILRSLGIGVGDEVIVPAHTYIATALAIAYTGATPVFVDVEENFYSLNPNLIEKKITNKTKAIICVHIYGQVGLFDEINKIAKKYNLYLIEDAAQAHGATYKGLKAGNLGDAAGFSFYPGKNLGAMGDAGCICTSNDDILDNAQKIRNYGSSKKYKHELLGVNSRMDEMQAAILKIKLKKLDEWNEDRRRIANRFINEIHNDKINLPKINQEGMPVWHIFPIMTENRKNFIDYMKKCEINCQIHYPIAMYNQEAFKYMNESENDYPVATKIANQEVSLPIYPGLSEEGIEYVIRCINQY